MAVIGRPVACTLALVTAVALGAPAALAGGPDETGTWPTVSDAEVKESITDIVLDVVDIELPKVEGVERPSSGPGVMTLDPDILFDFGTAILQPAAVAKVTEIAASLPDGARVTVSGHTDSIGDEASNQALSEARAAAVAATLRAGKATLVVEEKGYGETQPVASNGSGDNDNPEGRALNRRVEIRTN